VRGLAAAARRAGAHVVEGVDVVDLEPHRLTTTTGTIRADVVVLATEAYSTQLPGRRRRVLPIYSMMIGSEPLRAAQWDAIGLADRVAPHRLRPAHRRRAHRLRRTRRALSLRVAGRGSLRHR
jgi:glycine/D-amino acid oxidase-like deaminating enzyme